MDIKRFLKDWTLLISMVCGVLAYFVYTSIPCLVPTRAFAHHLVAILQPLLIFSMLFITFCKVDPHSLRLRRWHLWLLLLQLVAFSLLAALLILMPDLPGRVVVEGAMLCFICPTATAAAVITAKLGGDAAGLATYTVLINLTTAVAVPLFFPLVHPHSDLGFWASFFLIVGKVFPMLICPFFMAMLVRWLVPRFHQAVVGCRDLAFYLWAISLSIAIAMTTRSMVHANVPWPYQAGIAAASLFACVLQFYLGHVIGRRCGSPISAGQALGQKNTVLAIWMGYTFLTPVTALAGGFYSIWHNVYNSWQLYRKGLRK